MEGDSDREPVSQIVMRIIETCGQNFNVDVRLDVYASSLVHTIKRKIRES